jgi:hypothetical protein
MTAEPNYDKSELRQRVGLGMMALIELAAEE